LATFGNDAIAIFCIETDPRNVTGFHRSHFLLLIPGDNHETARDA
jgi:hypothetical protein